MIRIILLALAFTAIRSTPIQRRGAPGVPDAKTASEMLSELPVGENLDDGTYSRKLFVHWVTVSGACNTRETVLQRDGEDVQVSKSCSAVSGRWFSPYDNATWTEASDVDIDHMVPLKNAWISGASEWTSAKRREFANDLVNPQLWAVTDNVNQEKSDQSPDKWKPPVTSFHCTYAKAWVKVKSVYQLRVTSAEKNALENMIATC